MFLFCKELKLSQKGLLLSSSQILNTRSRSHPLLGRMASAAVHSRQPESRSFDVSSDKLDKFMCMCMFWTPALSQLLRSTWLSILQGLESKQSKARVWSRVHKRVTSFTTTAAAEMHLRAWRQDFMQIFGSKNNGYLEAFQNLFDVF